MEVYTYGQPGLTQSAAPGATAISAAEVKNYSKVITTADDTLIADLIDAATTYFEEVCNRQLITATWVWTPERFARRLVMPRAPLQSVTTLKYYDSGGTQQTLSSAVYTVVTSVNPGYIVEAVNQTWPSLQGRPEAIEVTYKAGYGNAAANVPDEVRTCLLQLVDHFYHERSGVAIGVTSKALEFSTDSIIQRYRVFDEIQ